MSQHDIRAVFAEDGLTADFYDAAIDPADRIPENSEAVSEEDWQSFCAGGKRWDGNRMVDYTPPALVHVPDSVFDYQFAGQAAAEGIIEDDDAFKWVGQGITPDALVQSVQKNVTDPDRQKRVLLFLAGTTIYPRNHELTPLLAASFGKDTPEKVDAFFLAASQR